MTRHTVFLILVTVTVAVTLVFAIIRSAHADVESYFAVPQTVTGAICNEEASCTDCKPANVKDNSCPKWGPPNVPKKDGVRCTLIKGGDPITMKACTQTSDSDDSCQMWGQTLVPPLPVCSGSYYLCDCMSYDAQDGTNCDVTGEECSCDGEPEGVFNAQLSHECI